MRLRLTPTSGSFAYDVYDILVDKMLKGQIGFSADVAAVVLGAVSAIQSKIMLAVPSIIGGVVLFKADSILISLGAIF